MRTNISALVALNTVFGIPLRNVNRDTAFFVSCSSGRKSSVFTAIENAYWQVVAFHGVYRLNKVFDEIRNIAGIHFFFDNKICPFLWNLNLFHFAAFNYGSKIHVNDIFTLVAKTLDDGFFHRFKRHFVRDHI